MITNNYKAMLMSHLASVDGEDTPLLSVVGTNGTTYYLCGNGDAGFPTVVGDDVTLSASNAGVMLGTGDTAAEDTDYALETPITSGIVASATHMRGMDNGNPYIEYVVSVENTGYSSIILNEIGYIQTVRATDSQSSAASPITVAVMLERTVFSTPITVAAGTTKYIKYRMASAPGSGGGGGGGATLITKTVTANGTYSASSDNADGYSSVTVSIPSYDNISF